MTNNNTDEEKHDASTATITLESRRADITVRPVSSHESERVPNAFDGGYR